MTNQLITNRLPIDYSLISLMSLMSSISYVWIIIMLPEHKCPSPMYLSLQVQLYDPAVFLQLTFMWQSCSLVVHSSISGHHKSNNLLVFLLWTIILEKALSKIIRGQLFKFVNVDLSV